MCICTPLGGPKCTLCATHGHFIRLSRSAILSQAPSEMISVSSTLQRILNRLLQSLKTASWHRLQGVCMCMYLYMCVCIACICMYFVVCVCIPCTSKKLYIYPSYCACMYDHIGSVVHTVTYGPVGAGLRPGKVKGVLLKTKCAF